LNSNLHENARSALDCGSVAAALNSKRKGGSWRYRTPRCLRHNHFHGSEESRSDSSSPYALIRLELRWASGQSAIPRCARNDIHPRDCATIRGESVHTRGRRVHCLVCTRPALDIRSAILRKAATWESSAAATLGRPHFFLG
jgi:hypothetical protein